MKARGHSKQCDEIQSNIDREMLGTTVVHSLVEAIQPDWKLYNKQQASSVLSRRRGFDFLFEISDWDLVVLRRRKVYMSCKARQPAHAQIHTQPEHYLCRARVPTAPDH